MDYITVADFCKTFGVSRQAVQQRIKKKEIKAIKFGNKYLIPKEEILRVKMKGCM